MTLKEFAQQTGLLSRPYYLHEDALNALWCGCTGKRAETGVGSSVSLPMEREGYRSEVSSVARAPLLRGSPQSVSTGRSSRLLRPR
jgi:hypothetical protein